jgi:poly(hydroxyalkanoate) depolymerase family esterase
LHNFVAAQYKMLRRLREDILMLSHSPFVLPGIFGATAPRAGHPQELVTLWNPGNLRFLLLGTGRSRNVPLVVILHGCGQEAEAYARNTGWLTLAARHRFALLLVEQRAVNNPDLCFNWFSPLHNRRHLGEAASIAAAIQQLSHSGMIDPAKVFITGLSAGGAMASVMLATYPELFAAGAIIAGVPYGCANWVTGAPECMSGSARIAATDLASFVQRASPHKGPWPRISVWHGSDDERVVPTNGADIVGQWRTVHGLRARPHLIEAVAGHPHRVWLDRSGRPAVEQYEVTGLGHGTPIASQKGSDRLGKAGHNVVDSSISSTARIADFFGLNSSQHQSKSAVKAA